MILDTVSTSVNRVSARASVQLKLYNFGNKLLAAWFPSAARRTTCCPDDPNLLTRANEPASKGAFGLLRFENAALQRNYSSKLTGPHCVISASNAKNSFAQPSARLAVTRIESASRCNRCPTPCRVPRTLIAISSSEKVEASKPPLSECQQNMAVYIMQAHAVEDESGAEKFPSPGRLRGVRTRTVLSTPHACIDEVVINLLSRGHPRSAGAIATRIAAKHTPNGRAICMSCSGASNEANCPCDHGVSALSCAFRLQAYTLDVDEANCPCAYGVSALSCAFGLQAYTLDVDCRLPKNSEDCGKGRTNIRVRRAGGYPFPSPPLSVARTRNCTSSTHTITTTHMGACPHFTHARAHTMHLTHILDLTHHMRAGVWSGECATLATTAKNNFYSTYLPHRCFIK